jgi:hypothetical protein
MGEVRNSYFQSQKSKGKGHTGREFRGPEFEGAVRIFGAAFHVPHRYTAGHIFVPLFEISGFC